MDGLITDSITCHLYFQTSTNLYSRLVPLMGRYKELSFTQKALPTELTSRRGRVEQSGGEVREADAGAVAEVSCGCLLERQDAADLPQRARAAQQRVRPTDDRRRHARIATLALCCHSGDPV